MSEVTQILHALAESDPSAADQLLPLVYDELRKLASHRLAGQAPGQTLQPTALVHEAYLRLVGDLEGDDWDSRGHFFAAAAEAMRRILVENARRKGRRKRGGDRIGKLSIRSASPSPLAGPGRLIKLAAQALVPGLQVIDPSLQGPTCGTPDRFRVWIRRSCTTRSGRSSGCRERRRSEAFSRREQSRRGGCEARRGAWQDGGPAAAPTPPRQQTQARPHVTDHLPEHDTGPFVAGLGSRWAGRCRVLPGPRPRGLPT
jgi:RNA polymerase sigma factor (TIGR02999 family)